MDQMETDSPASPVQNCEPQEENAAPDNIPSSPLHETPASPDNELMDVDLRNIKPNQIVSLLNMCKKSLAEIYKERAIEKASNATNIQDRYTTVKNLQESFLRVATLGDVYNIYRSRPVWLSRSENEIVDIARQIIAEIPSGRTSVLTYIGLLIHENTNCFFSEKENAQSKVNYSVLQNATIRLIKIIKEMIESDINDQFVFEAFKWCCDLAGEISEHNNGRPTIKNCRTPESYLEVLLSCPVIHQFINMLDDIISELLKRNPHQCMSILFYSSRHGNHFNWIWVHIAEIFPGKVVENIFTIGGQQFKAYVDTVNSKKIERVAQNVMAQLHEEYRTRFLSLVEVFNILSRKGNIELKNTVTKMIEKSLENIEEDDQESCYNIIFFFKLVTISPDTLRYLVQNNHHLATPENFYRGMRQILSVDKEIILHSLTYQEFGSQMIQELSSESQAVVFKALAKLALNLDKIDDNTPTTTKVIMEGAFFAMCKMIDKMLVSAHIYEPIKLGDYPCIAAFSTGEDIQFMINTALANPNWAPQIIRYLHTVSIAFSKIKAAEIAARFLLTCKETQLLHVFCAYLSTIVPFYPGLMKLVYKDLFAVRDVLLSEEPACLDTHGQRFQRNLALLMNLRTIFEWDGSNQEEDNYIHNFAFNPRSSAGALLTGILSICVTTCSKELEAGNMNNVHSIVTEIGRLLKSMSPPINSQRNVIQYKTVILNVRHIYKISIQLAQLLKITLQTISKESENALFYFEEFRNNIIFFFSDYVNQIHLCGHQRKTGMAQLFFVSFLASCMLDCKNMFGEDIDMDAWKDPSLEQMKLNDDNIEYSFLESLKLMDTHQKISRLAHSGVIGHGAKRLASPFVVSNDHLLRSHVFLDAVRNICVTESSNDVVNTRHLAIYLVDIVCQDAVSAEMLFNDWELEKETVGKFQKIQKYYRSWLLRGFMNIVAEVSPCLWLCLPILKSQLADILISLAGSPGKQTKVAVNITKNLDNWMYVARKGNIVPKRFEYLLDFLPHVTSYEAYLIFLEVWRYFQRRTITFNAVEHAIETERTNRGGGAAKLQDNVEGNLMICRRILQRHIGKLGYLFSKLFPSSLQHIGT